VHQGLEMPSTRTYQFTVSIHASPCGGRP
jgi:hypothetical protein